MPVKRLAYMHAKLVALLVLCNASAVLGQDRLEPTSYTRGLEQDPVRGRIIAVVDGYTVKVLTANQQLIKVELAFIDCPELHQTFGNRAKQAMSILLFGRQVELEPHAINRYGSLVAMVYVDGTDAGLQLLKAGMAWPQYRDLSEAPADVQ
jgi:endonuclease YncB( thermonuclease family)